MKKYLLYLLAFVFFTPMTIFAQDKVSVKSIELLKDETKGNAEETRKPEAHGLNIDVGVEFYTVGDSVKYKVVVENQDKEDYQLNTGKEFKSSDYINYTYTFDNDSNILKANTTKVMYVTLTYGKEVPNSALNNGSYHEENDMSIGVLREEDNPKTGRDEIIVIAVVLGLVVIIGAVMIKNKQTKYLVLALGSLLVVIPTVHAIKQVTITMNTEIMVEREMEFCVYEQLFADNPVAEYTQVNFKEQYRVGLTTDTSPKVRKKLYYKYTPGVTFREYFDNTTEDIPYFNIFVTDEDELTKCITAADEYYNNGDYAFRGGEASDEVDEYTKCYNKYLIFFESEDDLLDSNIKSKTAGCYDYFAVASKKDNGR